VLAELKIKSFGIIDELTWSLSKGFNAVTGETGAGKSLVIDAIESLLDGKIDEDDIRYGADAARIEAVFFLAKTDIWPKIRALLEDKGIAVDEDDLVASCEFRRGGRAVLRINGAAVNRGLMREVGALLVDIHGQSEHLSLFDKRHHLDYLDAYAHVLSDRGVFGEKAASLYWLQDQLMKINQAETDRIHRQEILRYQHDEIGRGKLKDGEEEELTQRRRVISSSEKLKSLAYQACQALNGEDGMGSAVSRLNEAVRAVESLVSLDPSLKPQAETLQGAVASAEETARDLRRYEEGLEYDPRELEEIESRLELIHSLKKKYGNTISQILEKHRAIDEELLKLESLDNDKVKLEQDIDSLKKELGVQAEVLSSKRKEAAKRFETAVENELKDLNMLQVRFGVRIEQTSDPPGLLFKGRGVSFTKDGADQVEFMVSTNPGEPMKPLAEIASTGEVSRFTLALKVALAEADSTPVLVFDEIDIGVGGRSGDVIGKKLWSLARHHQVLSVTHLPQIAVYGDTQYSVRKAVSGERTASTISTLDTGSRGQELAAMLGGASPSETSLKNAKELLQKAEAWKKTQK
jgi:DNA repair protein RecN (Recombination protein N)